MIPIIIGFVLPAVVFAVIGAVICMRKSSSEKKSQYVSLDSPTFYSVNVREDHRVRQHLPRTTAKQVHQPDAYHYQMPPVTCCHPETKLSPPPCYAEISGNTLSSSKSAGCIPSGAHDLLGWNQRYMPPPPQAKLPYENASYHLDAQTWLPNAYVQRI
ncbi:hypothetical protein AAVH_12063 [Aphelenchoides avenae]|nr:hypothetical protein AAVH_12063 [Aphelenchus avenae]